MFIVRWLERKLVFRSMPASTCWEPKPTEAIEDVWMSSTDGTRIHAWWYPVEDSLGTVLFCHGNAGNISGRGQTILRFGQLLRRSIFMFDYPGYGHSTGKTSEASCYAAAETAYRWLTKQLNEAAERITLYGESLGGGVAVELATRLDHQALVLMKSFTCIQEVAKRLYPWLPISALMSTKFDNLAKIGQCHRPVMIANGTHDQLIPFEQAERLYKAANEPKELIALEGSNHNDVLPDEFFPRLANFLDRRQVTVESLGK